MDKTKIQWTDATWNPVRGCSRVSPGCDNCYAMRQAHRSSGPGGAYEGLTRIGKRGVDWAGVARLIPEQLEQPLRWQRPRRIFVNSMSDLFHESLDFCDIAAVFGIMAAARRHTFQVLTKRPSRALEFFDWLTPNEDDAMYCHADEALMRAGLDLPTRAGLMSPSPVAQWPLPNVWLGVSTENQETADERIPLLLKLPAAVRFISAEPLLGPLLLDNGETSWLSCNHQQLEPEVECCSSFATHGSHFHGIDWVIVGGESGNGARLFEVRWADSLVEQCASAGVACFVKQLGAVPWLVSERVTGRLALNNRKGGDIAEFPKNLQVREFPNGG